MLESTVAKLETVQVLPTQYYSPCNDGVPMETDQHKLQTELLINSLKPWLEQHGGGCVDGNLFVYINSKQLPDEEFKGPYVFVVLGRSKKKPKNWTVWEESKGIDVLIELLPNGKTKTDKNDNKRFCQNQFKVPEYFWFDSSHPEDCAGFYLQDDVYEDIPLDAQNRLFSRRLGLKLLRWHGVYENIEAVWLRWATLKGGLLLTLQECASLAEQRANTVEQRADAAEAEVARLRALLAEKE